MATKKELIKIIKNSDNSEDWGDLNSMKKSELEQIAAYVEKLEEIEEEEVNYEFEEEMILGAPIDDEQTVIDPLPEPEEEKVLPENTQEYIEHKKPSELSKREQREYARTGKLPVKKK